MTTTLIDADLGPVSLPAPEEITHSIRATHGHLWQWTGDGEELYSLSVAVRETRLGTPTGLRHHLTWEVERVLPDFDPPAQQQDLTLAPVEGATAVAAVDLTGIIGGAQVLHRVISTTDGEFMHVIRVLVPDGPLGRHLADTVTSGIRVRPWSASA